MSDVINIQIDEVIEQATVNVEECEEQIDINVEETTDVVNLTIQEVGVKGDDGLGAAEAIEIKNRLATLELVVESGEDITSHKPIAIVNNKAYLYDASNILHLHAFSGFSITGALQNEMLTVKQQGIVTLNGWGLTQAQTYLAGVSGNLATINTGLSFTRIIGYAEDSNSLLIIKESPIIN